MYYGSEEFNNAIENTQGSSFKTRLKFSDKEIIEEISSMRYFGGSNDSDDISIGTTAMAYVDVSAFTNEILTGREFLLERGAKLSDGTYEYAPIGYFTVQTPSGDYDETTFTAYDRMIKFEKPYTSNLTYPTNSAAVLNEICEMCRVTVGTPIANPITITENLKGYTCREILGYIAGIHGFFACIDRFGELNLCWYSDTPIEKPLSCMWSFNKSQEQYEIEKVEIAKDGETSYTSGDGITTLHHSNPYATQEVANSIYASLYGFAFTPGEMEMLDDIRLDPWDVIKVTYYDGIDYLIPAMVIEHDFGGASTTIKAVGKTSAENEYRFEGPTIKYLNRMATDVLVANRVLATKVDAEWVQANTLTVDNADLRYAQISQLDTIEANIKEAVIGDLSAEFATVDQLKALNVEVIGKLDVADLNAEVADLGYITAEEISSKYATIDELSATNATVNGKLSASEADLRYADISLANVEKASISTMFADIGLIDRATIVDGHVTGYLDSVEVNANKITAGTLAVDRLVFRGENSIVYELNNITGALQAVQGDTLNGEILTDRSITVDKIVANSITANELDVDKVFGNEAVLNTLTTQEAFINAISTNEIVVGASSKADEALNLSQSTNTVSGNPILITDSADGKIINFAYDENIGDITNLEVKITNKNFIINSGAESYTANGVTFTKNNEDGSVTIVGIPTANTSYDISRSIYLPAGHHIISGFPNVAGRLTVAVDGVNRSSANGGELEFEVAADGTYRTLIVVNAGVEYNHTVHPMIRPVGTDGTYKPHQEYIVNIPLSESLTEDVQEAIRNMPTYAGGTYITATSGINMEAEYYRNTVTGQQLANIYNTAKNADDAIAQWCYENDITIIDGRKIATGTITADKLTVNDLSSLSAKIGKLTIDENGILTSIFVHDDDIVEEGSLTDDYININYDYLAPSVNAPKRISGSTKLGFEKLCFNRTNGYTAPHYSIFGKEVGADEVTTLYEANGISWEKNYIDTAGDVFSSISGGIEFYDVVTQVGMNVSAQAFCRLNFYEVISNRLRANSIETMSGANLNTVNNELTTLSETLNTLNNSAFKSQEPITDANTALANGAYRVGDATINTPGTGGILLVFTYGTGTLSGSAVFQIYVEYNGQYQTRMGWYGTWFSWSSTTYSLNDTQAIEQKGEIL